MDRARTYVLKVWTPVQGGFRASLRAVDQDGARWFDSAEALAGHLRCADRAQGMTAGSGTEALHGSQACNPAPTTE
jgi:hypothetical protein